MLTCLAVNMAKCHVNKNDLLNRKEWNGYNKLNSGNKQ